MDKKATQANGLISYYSKLYQERYKTSPKINRYKEKWGMIDVIDSLDGGYERAKRLLEYYFTLNKSGHPIQWFLYNFERMDALLIELEAEQEKREAWRKETAERVARWNKEQSERRNQVN